MNLNGWQSYFSQISQSMGRQKFQSFTILEPMHIADNPVFQKILHFLKNIHSPWIVKISIIPSVWWNSNCWHARVCIFSFKIDNFLSVKCTGQQSVQTDREVTHIHFSNLQSPVKGKQTQIQERSNSSLNLMHYCSHQY